MAMTAAYLTRAADDERSNSDWVPEASRRARGFAVYAALRSLGREGSRRWSSAAVRWRSAWRRPWRPTRS